MTPATVAATTPLRNETEERLLDAALTLFASKGYAATSVREIIEATGVTRPVLYYYCESKQDLFARVVRWKHDNAYQELTAELTGAPSVADSLKRIARGTFEFCAADPRVPQLMFQTTFGPVVSELAEFLKEMSDRRFTLIASILQRGLDSGELQGGSAKSLALLFCGIMDYHANALCRLDKPQERLTVELADELVEAFLHGVATGRKQAPQIPETL